MIVDTETNAAGRAREEKETRARPQGHDRWPWADAPGKLALAALFGMVFGFLLQKGGVAKFDILLGALLLEDFTVVKVMGAAIVVGMIGVPILRRLGLIEVQIKEAVLGRNIGGGLIFGVGFALLAYCPGTDAAAVGQGNLDAIVGIAGLTLGSYLFALSSGTSIDRAFDKGRLGKVRLNDLLKIPEWLACAGGAVILIAILAAIEVFVER